MRRTYQISSVLFLGFAVFTMLGARDLEYDRMGAPGPGFFPFWVGLFLVVLSVGWFAAVTFLPADPMPADFIPDRNGAIHVVAIIGTLVFAAAMVNTFGFQLTTFVFLMFLLAGLGRQKLALSTLLSLAGSAGLYYAFTTWLDLPLPASSIELLKGLGL